MLTFEQIHQMARVARAKGQAKVILPHAEFRDAMEAFYADVVSQVTRAGKKNLAQAWVKEARALH